LTFVRFIPDDASDTSVQAQIDYIDELRHLCREKTNHCLVRGKNEAQALVEVSAGYDLLVMGEAEKGFLRTVFFNKREKLTERAACSVLRLKTPRSRIHTGFKEERTHDDVKAANLLDFLSPHSVVVRLRVTTKESLFQKIGEVLSSSLPGISSQSVIKALWAREEMQNTAVGDDLALPHGTLDELREPLVGVFTTDRPVDYGPTDGMTVQVCFVTLCPPSKRQIHLKLLASMARLVENTDFVARQRGARTTEEAMAALRDCLAELNRAE
jgi:mannitol/fructose-specific phosphotransferase system IIA component (Ntr-type)